LDELAFCATANQEEGTLDVMGTSYRFYLGLVVLGVFVGCGDKQTTSSALAPSPTPAQTAALSSGASIGGTVQGPNTPQAVRPLALSGVRVSVIGTSVSTLTDANGHFALTGIAHGPVTLSFQGSGINATLAIGTVADGQQITITVTVSASTATLDSEQDNSGNVDVEGVIAGLSGVCPTLTFTVGGRTIRTETTTTFDAAPCSSLRNGDHAEVHGTLQPGGSVLATHVEVTLPDDDQVEAEGTVSGLKGSCPTVTFTLGGKTFTTSTATKFDGVSCASLTNGITAQAQGTLQSSGSVLASEVESEGEGGGSGGGNGDHGGDGSGNGGGDGNSGGGHGDNGGDANRLRRR
jgi:hypothetical protein